MVVTKIRSFIISRQSLETVLFQRVSLRKGLKSAVSISYRTFLFIYNEIVVDCDLFSKRRKVLHFSLAPVYFKLLEKTCQRNTGNIGESDHMTYSAKLRTNVRKLLLHTDMTRLQPNRDCHVTLTSFLLGSDSVQTPDCILRSNCSHFLNRHRLC